MIKLLPIILLLTTTPYDMAKKYRPSNDSQVIAKGGSFNPQKIGSAAGAMRAEFDRQNANQNLIDEQDEINKGRQLSNLEQRKLNAQAFGKDMVDLAALSGTLTDTLIGVQKTRNEEARQRGIMKAYTDGTNPESQAEFDERYEALEKLDEQGRAAAADAYAKGVPADRVRQIRKLSGWEGVGYAEGQARMGGYQYGDYFREAKRNVKVMINGEEKTYDQAETLPERQEIEDAIRQSYIARYSDMKPEMLQKAGFFDSLRKYEAAEAIQWQKDQDIRLQNEKDDETRSYILDAVRSEDGGARVYKALEKFEKDYGSAAGVRKFISGHLQDLAESGLLSVEEAQKIQRFQFKNRSNKWTTLGEQFPEFATLDRTALKIDLDKAKDNDRQEEINKEEFEVKLKEEERDMLNEEPPRRFTEDDKKKMIADWQRDFGGEIPDYLNTLLTRETEDDKLKQEQLDQLRASRGYLTEGDLVGSSTKVYLANKDKIADTRAMASVPQELIRHAHKSIEAQLRSTLTQAGLSSSADDPVAAELSQRGIELHRQLLSDYLNGGMKVGAANDEAIRRVQEMLKPQEAGGDLTTTELYKPKYGYQDETEENQRTQRNALTWVGNNKEKILTEQIPGTTKELNELVKFAETKRGSIPRLYKLIANSTNGQYSDWDIAEMQLKATGKGTLMRPKIEQEVQKLNPNLQRLLNFKPTNASTYQALTGDYLVAGPATGSGLKGNWKTFLDMVASVESESYGGYDAYNLGGTNNGHTAHGSGNSNDGRFGKPLSQLTVQDVINLGLAPTGRHIHAAGRYQFIPGTLRETVREAGIDPKTTLFDEATQDLLAVTRARWRIQNDRGMAGLRREWVGLNYVKDAVLRPAMKGIVNTDSPYNQPELLSPAVRKKVYK